MGYLTPQNVRVHGERRQRDAREHQNIANESESWYDTKYKKEKVPRKISKGTMDMWNSLGFINDLKLPPKDEFTAITFDIKPQTNVEKFPIILKDTSFVRLWYKKDDKFFVPRTRMIFNFFSPFVYMDPLSHNFNCMFIELLSDSLNEYTYDAELVGLEWKLNSTVYGMILSIDSYDNKQCMLLEKIIDRMINFKVDPKRFEDLKEKYIRDLTNFAAEQPHEHAVYYLLTLLAEQAWLKKELLEATTYLSVEGLQRFIPYLLSKVHVECLIHGNVTITEVIDIHKLIESKGLRTIKGTGNREQRIRISTYQKSCIIQYTRIHSI